MTPTELILSAIIGLIGGTLGGFLGIGGGLVIIPALAVIFGNERQHLHQAAVMMVNLLVSLAAVGRHIKAGAVRVDALKGIVPATILLLGVGVWVGDLIDGQLLARLFALFLIYVIGMNAKRIIAEFRESCYAASGTAPATGPPGPQAARGVAETTEVTEPLKERINGNITLPGGLAVGTAMGFFSGLLGIGGGGIAVPLQQVIFRMPLKHCIGTSTAAICITAAFGAFLKNWRLDQHDGLTFTDSWQLALTLAPTAIVGGYLGAHLTHILPTRWIRVAFVVLLAFAALKMAGVVGG